MAAHGYLLVVVFVLVEVVEATIASQGGHLSGDVSARSEAVLLARTGDVVAVAVLGAPAVGLWDHGRPAGGDRLGGIHTAGIMIMKRGKY